VFPKSLRIKKSSDFKLLFTKGKSLHSPQLKLQVLYGGMLGVTANLPTKYAVITPKGVGKAHDRNRIRRQLLAQLRAWHEERYGKIGKAGNGATTESTSIHTNGPRDVTTIKTTPVVKPQPLVMLAVYVKASMDNSNQLQDLGAELSLLLTKF